MQGSWPWQCGVRWMVLSTAGKVLLPPLCCVLLLLLSPSCCTMKHVTDCGALCVYVWCIVCGWVWLCAHVQVSRSGSVVVEKLMEIERYSHVMHISSTVTGQLQPGLDSWDALRAALPAGTVSGAPKVGPGAGRGGM